MLKMAVAWLGGCRSTCSSVLKGSLVEVRPLRQDDFDALYTAASDPLIWEQHPQRDRHEADVFRTYFAERPAGR